MVLYGMFAGFAAAETPALEATLLSPEFQSLSEGEKDQLFQKMKYTTLSQEELFSPGELVYTVNDVGKIEKGSSIIASTKTVYVMIVADEEFRTKFGSTWKQQAFAMLEGGDDSFIKYHDIDMVVNYYYETWDSNDTANFGELLDEAQTETGWDSDDRHSCTMIAIFTDQTDGNIAGKAEVPGNAWAMRSQGNYTTDHHVSQHEMSHNYDCHHHSWDPNDPCIMARCYDTFEWCATCDTTIENNKYTYPS